VVNPGVLYSTKRYKEWGKNKQAGKHKAVNELWHIPLSLGNFLVQGKRETVLKGTSVSVLARTLTIFCTHTDTEW